MSSTSESCTSYGAEDRPLISVIMANYRGAPYLRDAIDSVLKQSVMNIELIISDDASPDDSVKIVEDIMLRDKRVKLLIAENNSGPARARNRALSIARGHWIAVVDSDDLLHPNRFEWLLGAASHYNAAIVADDLLHFSTENGSEISYLLNDQVFSTPFEITVGNFMSGTDSQMPAFGYLKPMFHSSVLQGFQYDEALKIGEDYDLVLRLLFNGAKYILIPQPFYLYRRHSNSISHRLSETTVQAMIENSAKLRARFGHLNDDIDAAFQNQLNSLRETLEFERFIAAAKDLRIRAILKSVIKRPAFIKPLGIIVCRRALANLQKLQKKLVKTEVQTNRKNLVVFLKDEKSDREQIAQALSFCEKNNSKLHIEEISAITNPADSWMDSQVFNKAQLKRITSMAPNTHAFIYHSSELEFITGFIPGKIKRIQVEVPQS
jgi:succinoglycan biosynthesis protein ExoO